MVKLINVFHEKSRSGETCISFEFFPPKVSLRFGMLGSGCC